MRLLAGHGMGCMVGNGVNTEGQFESEKAHLIGKFPTEIRQVADISSQPRQGSGPSGAILWAFISRCRADMALNCGGIDGSFESR
jgi:hypothetical protein